MKKQILIIHGGDTFDTYEEYLEFLKNDKLDFEKIMEEGWKDTLDDKFGEDFEVIYPEMPNSKNAKYTEWKILFEKLLPFLQNNLVLVGHSLGGIFLAKYLSENKFPKKILATYLIAAPYNDKDSEYSLGDFILPDNLEKLERQGGKIFIYHSEDDPVVPFVDAGKYKESLPNAARVIFKDREHFTQEEFPELAKDIKNLYKNKK
ncbi:alpha/beta hydrolase [Patescibacteria group bacterium]|nr:alpha/beta hydrolase [Patescibacteria group bacterium]